MVEGAQRARQPKDSWPKIRGRTLEGDRKKAAPEGAAKFREETPKKGRGAPREAILRCNNMAVTSLRCKKNDGETRINFFQ
ncbi:MAG TPA: hypothetical protein VN932_02705 [Rhizomicrobium sp.]|nr:hypothetical protein [Rhizomicrobium sp.]